MQILNTSTMHNIERDVGLLSQHNFNPAYTADPNILIAAASQLSKYGIARVLWNTVSTLSMFKDGVLLTVDTPSYSTLCTESPQTQLTWDSTRRLPIPLEGEWISYIDMPLAARPRIQDTIKDLWIEIAIVLGRGILEVRMQAQKDSTKHTEKTQRIAEAWK